MIRKAAILALLMGLGCGVAHAQVSDSEYASEYNFIISNTWRCATAQTFSGVQDGELNMEQDFSFQPKNDPGDPYTFTGTSSAVMNVDNVDYRGRSSFDGYGFNDTDRGVGVVITNMVMTQQDTLPDGWYWNNGDDYMQLVLTRESNGTYSLKGYSIYQGTSVSLDCGG